MHYICVYIRTDARFLGRLLSSPTTNYSKRKPAMPPDHHDPKDGTQSPDLEAGVDRPPTPPIPRALWNFSSQWFLVPQGTGIIGVILHQLDYQFRGLAIISVIVWIYTIALLMVSLLLYLLRIFMYPRHVARELRTNMIETACLASISITFTSMIQMIALVLVRQWGPA
jgi:hypothetical protein